MNNKDKLLLSSMLNTLQECSILSKKLLMFADVDEVTNNDDNLEEDNQNDGLSENEIVTDYYAVHSKRYQYLSKIYDSFSFVIFNMKKINNDELKINMSNASKKIYAVLTQTVFFDLDAYQTEREKSAIGELLKLFDTYYGDINNRFSV